MKSAPLVAALLFSLQASASQISSFEMQRFVPSQSSSSVAPNDRKWSCGPNSGARALAMLPHDGICVAFQEFMQETPATIGRINTGFIKATQAVLAAALALPPLLLANPGSKTVAWLGLVAAGLSTPRWLAGFAPVGPHPAALATYLQKFAPTYVVQDQYFHDFEDVLATLRKNILDHDRPVIAHFCYGALALHYVNVVGMSEDGVSILDTNGAVYQMDFDRLKELMTTDVPVLNPLLFSRYNLIVFDAPVAS